MIKVGDPVWVSLGVGKTVAGEVTEITLDGFLVKFDDEVKLLPAYLWSVFPRVTEA
jgi:hypothetical protein